MSHSFVGVAQLDRAFGYGPKGRGFESSRPRIEETVLNNIQRQSFFCVKLDRKLKRPCTSTPEEQGR